MVLIYFLERTEIFSAAMSRGLHLLQDGILHRARNECEDFLLRYWISLHRTGIILMELIIILTVYFSETGSSIISST